MRELVEFSERYAAGLGVSKNAKKFVEIRNGTINISPIGQGCSIEERQKFEEFDRRNHIREKMIKVLQKNF